jgi:NTE family protein
MNKKIALVLSGGGARGNAHIGVIEELLGQGFEISSVTGTSMGSLVGGAYAYGKLEVLKEWMLSLDRRRVFSLVDFTLSRHGIVKGDKVFNAMKEFIPDTRIETLPIPFAAIAVDLVTKHEVVFREGSLFNAIRASVAIPTVMTPVKSNGSLLVDGGVLNNIPISHARRQKGDLLVVANVNANVPVSLPEFNKEEDDRFSIPAAKGIS